MHKKVGLLLLTILWFRPFFMHAQQDSLNALKYPTQYSTEASLDRNLPNAFEDTVVHRDEIYLPYTRKTMVYQDLGNIGSPGRSLHFDWNRKTDFVLGFNPYKIYYKTPEETHYYKTRKPYADFTYTQGQRELLLFGAKYAMNFSPRFNVGVDYNRITSEGFYPRQYTSGYFTNVNTNYQSKNNRYGMIANAIWNRGVLDENGGLDGDSLFETLRGSNKAAPVRLQSSQSRFKSKTYFVKQYLYLGHMKESVKDEDTTYHLSRSGFLSHTFRFDEDNFFFDNPDGNKDSLMFPLPASDTTGIFHDSIQSKTWMNRFAYAYWTKSTPLHQSYIEFALAHKYIEVSQWDQHRFYQNVWGEAKMERIPKTETNIGLRMEAAYCMSGYNQNDFKVGGDIRWLSGNFNLVAGFSNQLSAPDYTQVYYRSAPYSWNKNFSKINVSNWRAGLSTKGFKHNLNILFNQYIIANWVYNGTLLEPEQSNKILIIHSLEANKTFQLGWFYFDNRILLQKANLDLIRLPEVSAQIRYYLQTALFKKALRFQMGVEAWYNTAYYGNAYNPSTRVFYLQNQTLIGNYPMIDVFFTGQIKTAVIFAKLEHINMDWQNTGYYYTPHYPLPVKVFRLGVRLRLYN